MLQAAIISKPQKPELAGILRELIAWLDARQYSCLLDPPSAAYMGSADGIERPDLPELHSPTSSSSSAVMAPSSPRLVPSPTLRRPSLA